MARVFDLLYGEPGSGKSRSLMALIKQMHEATGKIARVYTGDGSYGFYQAAGLEDAGMIKLMDFSIRDYPFTVMQQICEGLWPVDPLDPKAKMVKLTPDELAKTGMWVFEGASVAGNFMLGDKEGGLARRAAKGETIGQDAPVMFSDSPEYKFGGNAGAHYNVGQRHILADILRSKSLPGEVYWTAHERVDDGERGGAFAKGQTADKVKIGEKIIGPELVGKALTSSIAREFRNTLHFVVASKKEQGPADPVSGKTGYTEKTDYRVYTRDHFDPDGIVGLKYRAVVRSLDPTQVELYYSADKPGQALLNLYAALEKSNKL